MAVGLVVAAPAQFLLVATLLGSPVLHDLQALFVWGALCLAANAAVYIGADQWRVKLWQLPTRSPGS